MIVKEVKGWVDDPRYSRTREMKYFKLGEILDSKGHGGPSDGKVRKENNATLQAIKMLEGKFELFSRSQFSIKFIVTPDEQKQEKN
jgi:hypothetical protein